MNLENSVTSQNVKKAFMREAAAYMEYYFYAEQAKNDGFQEIYNTYKTICQNELAHAKIWFKLYHTIFTTKDNLKNSADLEKFEYSKVYKDFAKIAKDEGFPDIATLMEKVQLNRKWTFWENYEMKDKSLKVEWSDLMKKIFTFDNLIQFWQFWNIYPGRNPAEIYYNGDRMV